MKRWLARIGFTLLGLVIGILMLFVIGFTSFSRIPTLQLEHESLSVIALGRGVNEEDLDRFYWQSVYPVKLLIDGGGWNKLRFEIYPEIFWPTMKVSLSKLSKRSASFAGEGLSLSLDGAPCLQLKQRGDYDDPDFENTALSKTLEMPPGCEHPPDFDHELNVVLTNATGEVLSSYKLKYRFTYNGIKVGGLI